MKSMTYYGSGYSKTIMDIGDYWPLMDSALSMAINGYKRDFKKLVESVYKEKSMVTLGPHYIWECKKSIRTLQRIRQLLNDGEVNAYTNYDEFLAAIK